MAVNKVHNSRFDYIKFGDIAFDGSLDKENYISITMVDDDIEDAISADGSVGSLAIKNDLRADVTIRVQSQSPVNAYLNSLRKAQRDTGQVVVDSITTVSNGTVHLYDLQDCFIKKAPDESKSSGIEGSVYEWQFRCMRAEPRDIAAFNFSAEISANLTSLVDLTLSTSVLL